MFLTPPSPTIDLYNEGFDPHKDLLNRAESGERLSALVEKISEPIVVALDGGWGSGKSFFLKCWVGAHKIDGGSANTVYFDAFENDFINEPLASLMGVIAERLEHSGDKTGKTQSALAAMKRTALPLTRIALAVASSGLTEVGGAIVDAVAKQGNDKLNKAAEAFWEREQGKRVAMAEFRNALTELTAPLADDDVPQKLVIVIDELDRCRPDYALAILEIIKHFFDVPHVHFVLGVNLSELEISVRARYGAGIDAALYLQKFISVTMGLPDVASSLSDRSTTMFYFSETARKAELDQADIELYQGIIGAYRDRSRLSLRGMEQLIPMIILSTTPKSSGYGDEPFVRIVIASLIFAKAWERDFYQLVLLGVPTMKDVEQCFAVKESSDSCDATRLFDGWQFFLEPLEYHKRAPSSSVKVAPTVEQSLSQLRRLMWRHIETFELLPGN